jgi:hypothetical protein
MKSTKKKTPSTRTRAQTRHPVIPPLQLDAISATARWFPEPELEFSSGENSCDPKVGVPLYGPRSLGTGRHKNEIHIGFIGTRPSVSAAQIFLSTAAEGVDGDDDHAPFPGCTRDDGYRMVLRTDDATVELITRQESEDVLKIRGGRQRFETFLQLLEAKIALLAGKDHPLDYVVLALSDELYRRCKVVDYFEKGKGGVHRDLRRAFKAVAMRHKIATQILLDSTTQGFKDDGRRGRRQLDHPSVIAWNLFTGMYFKADGLPWGPSGLPPGSCFIGVSFFRPLGSTSQLRTSVVQAFDENGEGLVLRGHTFPWDDAKQGKSPHLTEDGAQQLVGMVLERYRHERNGQLPQRVVVHKTSRFEPAERRGFEEALKAVHFYDLVSLRPTSDVRLLRNAQYPPIRGSAFTMGDMTYLYTTGYIPHLGGYPHGHVPSPLQLADHVGDTSPSQLFREVLVLTKMNWNSANMEGLMPVTLRFSRSVGEILREIPESQEPDPKYKYYI